MFEQYNDIVTIEDMAEMLGIGKNYAYNLLHSKKIKAFRNGRIWRIPKQAIVEYIVQSTGIIVNLYIPK